MRRIKWFIFVSAEFELEELVYLLKFLCVTSSGEMLPRLHQTKEFIVEDLPQVVGEVVLGIFGPGQPGLVDGDAPEIRLGDAVDVVLVLVRNDRAWRFPDDPQSAGPSVAP